MSNEEKEIFAKIVEDAAKLGITKEQLDKAVTILSSRKGRK